ncbi:MAG: transposase [Bacillota bacterium]
MRWCQIGVSMSYATATASVPLTWQLYLPEVWAQDQMLRGIGPQRLRKWL